MEMITSAQIKRIHTLVHLLGWSDDNYRAWLQDRFAVRSCKQLDLASAAWAIRLLGYKQPVSDQRNRHWFKAKNGLATPLQCQKIRRLWAKVSWGNTPEEREQNLATWLLKREAVNAPERLNSSRVGAIIRTLESFSTREEVFK